MLVGRTQSFKSQRGTVIVNSVTPGNQGKLDSSLRGK